MGCWDMLREVVLKEDAERVFPINLLMGDVLPVVVVVVVVVAGADEEIVAVKAAGALDFMLLLSAVAERSRGDTRRVEDKRMKL